MLLTIIEAIFKWALHNQMIMGFFTLVGSKIYILIEDYIKKKYFPEPKEVVVEQYQGRPIKRKVPNEKRINIGYALLLGIFILFGFYVFFTYQQFPYLKESQIVEEIEKIKLFIILFTVFLSVKLLSFSTTLEDMFKSLPLIKSFFKK